MCDNKVSKNRQQLVRQSAPLIMLLIVFPLDWILFLYMFLHHLGDYLNVLS